MLRNGRSFFAFFLILFFYSTVSLADYARGIYLSENTARNSQEMEHLIKEAKASGVNTFVIDVTARNPLYEKNVRKVVASGIQYVARVTMFPGGATHEEMVNRAIWAKRLALAQYAISLGAKQIQLDYIRYSSKPGTASPEKARYVYQVIKYFREHLPPNIKLQIDIFGIATFKPAHTIGQDPGLFAHTLNAMCPMVYPSHYDPYRYYAVRPYQTVFESIEALKKQLPTDNNVAIYPYIELYNYRYPMTIAERTQYAREEIKAAKDSGAKGYYVWSAANRYDILFSILKPNLIHEAMRHKEKHEPIVATGQPTLLKVGQARGCANRFGPHVNARGAN